MRIRDKCRSSLDYAHLEDGMVLSTLLKKVLSPDLEERTALVYTSHGNPVPGQEIQRPVPANLVQELAPRLAYAESRKNSLPPPLPSSHLSPPPSPARREFYFDSRFLKGQRETEIERER